MVSSIPAATPAAAQAINTNDGQGVTDALPVLVDQLERLKHKEAPPDYSSRRITRLLELQKRAVAYGKAVQYMKDNSVRVANLSWSRWKKLFVKSLRVHKMGDSRAERDLLADQILQIEHKALYEASNQECSRNPVRHFRRQSWQCRKRKSHPQFV